METTFSPFLIAAEGLASPDCWLLCPPPELWLFLVSPQAATRRATATATSAVGSTRDKRDVIMPSPLVAGSGAPRRATATCRDAGTGGRAPRERAGRRWARRRSRRAGRR